MLKNKKLIIMLCLLILPFYLLNNACKKDDGGDDIVPHLELFYTDIHLLENDSIDVKIIIEPENAKNQEVIINLPESSCIKSATVETIDGEKYLHIVSSDYIEGENDVMSGAYIYINGYDIGLTQKSFNVTVHKEALVLTTPENLSYDENLGTLEWKKVDGARYYEININGDILSTSLTNMVLNQSYCGKKLEVKVRAVYDLVNKFPAFVDSEYSAIFELMVLNRPTNLHHNKGVIYWDNVQGATSYSLIIATPSIFGGRQNERIISVPATNFEVQSYSDYSFSSSTTYTIRVKANGNDNLGYKVYGTQDSNSIVVKKLTAPSQIAFVQGILYWDSVADSAGYRVEVQKFNTVTQEYSVVSLHTVTNANYYEFDKFDGSITSGQYMLSVMTLGNDVETLSGDETKSIVTNKLDKVQNVRISDGGVYWDKVELASSYTIYLNDSAISLIRDDKEFNSYFLGSSSVAGEYTISVVACGDGVVYYNSDKSDKITAEKLGTTSLTLSDNNLTWKKVTGATNYELNIFNEKILLGDVNSYTISGNIAGGQYQARIMAVAEGKISGEYSQTINFTKLSSPENLRTENGILRWDMVTNVTSYTLRLTYGSNDGENIKQSTSTITTINTNYDFKGQLAGIYTVSVSATGGNNTISSVQSSLITVKKLATPSAPRVENGKLVYNEINMGTLMVRVQETGQEMLASNYYPADREKLSLSLYAKGNNGENGENLISSGDSEVLVTTVVKSLTTPSIKDGNLIYFFSQGVTGIQIDFYRNGSLSRAYQINEYKDVSSTSKDFNGIINLKGRFEEGLYNLKITPLFSSGSIESVEAGNIAYIYGGGEMKLSFCQIAAPAEIGSFYLDKNGTNAINNSVSDKDFDEIVKSSTNNKYSGYLYWTELKEATAYLLMINEDETSIKVVKPSDIISSGTGLCLYRLDEDFTTDMNGYNFKVKALGDESNYLSSGYSAVTEVRKIKLNTVGEIKVKDGMLTWNNLDGAFYEVTYNGNIAYTYKNEFSLPDSTAGGSYQIKIRALPKNEYYYAGDYSDKDNVIKISSPVKFYVAGGQIQWSVVNYASRYVLDINGLIKEYDINVENVDLKYLVDTEEYFTEKNGIFNITFRVIGTEDSDKVSQSEYTYLSSSPVSVSATIMKSPESIYVENGILTWTPVTGATKYNLNFYHASQPNNIKNIYLDANNDNNTGNQFSLGTEYMSGIYYFTIKAIGDGTSFINSQFSEEYSAEKLSVVNNIHISDGKLTFDEKAGATAYNAMINVYNATTCIVEKFTGNIFSLGDDYTHGRYQIKFQAIGNTTSPDRKGQIGYLSSDYSFIASGYSEVSGSAVNYIYKLAPSENMYVANDSINWEKVKNAEGYNLKVDQTIVPLTDESSIQLRSGMINGRYYNFSSGNFEVNVQARGGEYFLNSAYRNLGLNVIKLDKVLGLGVDDGMVSWNTVNLVPDNLALYINGQYVANLRKEFFEKYDERIGGVRGEKTYYVLGEDYGPGEYSVYLVNMGGGTTGYLSSDACEPIDVQKVEAPDNVRISSSTNSIVWEMEELKNTDIKYIINLYNSSDDRLVQTFETLNQLSMVIRSLDVGEYYVKIGTRIISSDKLLINSNTSESLFVTMPAVPIGVKIQNGAITWNAIEGVSGYNIEVLFYEGTTLGLTGKLVEFRITVEGENNTNISIRDFTDDETFVCLSDGISHSGYTALGKYKVKVNAYIADSLQSDYSDYVGDNSSKGVSGYYLFNMFSDGKGTKENPYTITNFEQLQNIAYLPDLYYKQTSSIITNNMAFTPIGTAEKPFIGVYDGDGQTIDNLNVSISNPETELYVGLFGYIGKQGIIKDVTISKMTTTAGYYVGGIAGYNQGIIYNSKVRNARIESTTKTLTTTRTPIHIGGITGYNDIGAIIDMCQFTGTVTAKETITTYISYSGGIAGYNLGQIGQCDTNTNGDNDRIIGIYSGGIVGYNINTIAYNEDASVQPTGSIYKCTNRIIVEGYSLQAMTTISGYAGGICGMNVLKNDDLTGYCVTNNYSICYSRSLADVICNPNNTALVPYAGGLCGYAGNGMSSSYFTGAVYGLINGVKTTDITSGAALVNVGRIAGYKGANNFIVSYCFYIELEDSALNDVGAESKNSRNAGFSVGPNCNAHSRSEFYSENMANMLNEGLIGNSHSQIWYGMLGDLPEYLKTERTFD